MNQHDTETLKLAGDAVSISTLIGALLGALPHIATLLTVLWAGVRLYETATVQALLRRWRKHD